MSPRAGNRCSVAAAVLAFLVFVPWARRSIDSPIVLKPRTTVRLEAPEDAVVSEVLARRRHGARRRAGLRAREPGWRRAVLALAARPNATGCEKQASRARGLGRARRGPPLRAAGGVGGGRPAQRAFARRPPARFAAPSPGRILTPYVEDLQGRFVPGGQRRWPRSATATRCRADLPVTERLLDELRARLAGSRRCSGRAAAARARHDRVDLGGDAGAARRRRAARSRPRPSQRPDRFVARADFDNADGALRPGMTGKAKIYGRRASYLSDAWRVLRTGSRRSSGGL